MDEIDDACPSCRAPTISPHGVPDPNDLLVCAACGYTGLWDAIVDKWRLPTRDEMAQLINDEKYVAAQSTMMGLRMFRAQERADATAAVMRVIAGGMPSIFPKSRDRLAATLALQVMDMLAKRGYHRHPSDEEMEMFQIMEDLG